LTRGSPKSTRLWKESWWASARPLGAALWRGVEAQHFVSTMKLVDSLAEQEELERILEANKPALPGPAAQHYLLSTPFRYPSPQPSRFRPAGAMGVWYGAETVQTACTELAYWRWRFLMDSDGLRASELIAEFSVFRAKVHGSAVDLSVEPWDARRPDWTSDDYSACLTFATEARRRDVHWIRYWSARDVGGRCGAVLNPESFKGIELNRQQTWVCKVSATTALMRHEQDSISLTFSTRS
jgi:RES domain